MLAAVEFVRKKGPIRIVVASPVALDRAVEVLAPHGDELEIILKSQISNFKKGGRD